MQRPRRIARTTVLGLSFVLALGCADDDGGRVSGGPPPGGGDDGSGGSGEGDDGGDEDAAFDVAEGEGGGAGDAESDCYTIDFLFVVDNSASMEEEQQALIASFPGFVASVREVTGAESFHIMVTDSDDYCNGWPCPEGPFTICDETIGAGKVLDKHESPCPVEEPHRYMLTSQPDLEGTFACVAEVGTTGHPDERPMDSMVKAIGPDLNGAGGCNEGFVRNDAVLVIVIITDEEDDDEAVTGQYCDEFIFSGSEGEPQTWFDAVVAAKGVETNAVVLSLVGPVDPPCPGKAGCSGETGAEIAYRIVEFTEKFTYGSIGGVCAESYDLFFHDAVGVINIACDNYQPP